MDKPIFKVIELDCLSAEDVYPPIGEFVAESDDERQLWEGFLKTRPVSDQRKNKETTIYVLDEHPIHVLDRTRLKYVVEEGEHIIFKDAKTKEIIGMVWPNAVNNQSIIQGLTATIANFLNHTIRSARLSDPGLLVTVGYTAGSRSCRSLGWGKNLKAKADDRSEAYKMSCVFAHVWTAVEQHLPAAIRTDYEVAGAALDGLTMDAGTMNEDQQLIYTIPGSDTEFVASKKAPAAGVAALNYCRYTHNEKNLNEYCVKWNASRSAPSDHGGNFYIAQYGIFIPNHANQAAAWRGLDYHGTTLPRVEPSEEHPFFEQIGLAFILGGGLEDALKKAKVKPDTVGLRFPTTEESAELEEEVDLIPRETMKQHVRKSTTTLEPASMLKRKK